MKPQSMDNEIEAAIVTLTPREREALRLAWLGHTSRSAAATMGCSDRTVQQHWANGRGKLATNKTHVAARYLATYEARHEAASA